MTRQSERPHLCFYLSLLCLTALPAFGDISVETVTYGSVLKLEHIASGHRLHSHALPYAEGSGQQSVTGMYSAGDSNSLWIVKEAHGTDGGGPRSATPVRCGSKLRFQHLQTNKNLHSHLHHAPMNNDYEVSAYAVDSDEIWKDGDSGDDWLLQCDKVKDGVAWPRDAKIRLKHVDTGAYLSASERLKYPNPIANQLHVSARTWSNKDCYWKAAEGFFLAPKEETTN